MAQAFTSLSDVEATVNLRWDGANFRPQILLHPSQVVAIIVSDQVNCQTEVAEPSRSTNTVKVGLGILGEIEVDNNVHALNINTTGEEIRSNKVTSTSIAEFVEDSVTVGLLHLGMDVEARVAKLGNFLGEEFHAVDRVAEDDGLVDFQLGEEGVEAVNLLPLFDIGVELGDTPKC